PKQGQILNCALEVSCIRQVYRKRRKNTVDATGSKSRLVDYVALVVHDVGVVAGAAPHDIGAIAAVETIVTTVAVERIWALLAEQPVAICASEQKIITIAAVELVVARSSIDAVGFRVARQRVGKIGALQVFYRKISVA